MSSKDHRQRKWRGDDYRIICSCQIHARRERTLWRRSLRAASRLKARSIALLVGVPIALGSLQFPTEAMDVTIGKTMLRDRLAALTTTRRDSGFAIFTTERMREQFLNPTLRPRVFTLDRVKEHFFSANVPYGSIIYREATRNGLAPELVAAVIEAESDFRPRLVSNKNALGLMQIVPETGRLMGAEDLFNPTQNIAAGTKYLRYLLDRFPDQRMALAAYNAGEGNIEKFGGIPPFVETQNYLRRVSVRTNQYRQHVRGTYLASVRIQNSMTIR
ncbi:MAG TPA: transglycosylase SLT domain-containing protein [Thermoanaerobaculia bacterium]|jgi:soluble lytic murein transglycosylase-like protein|nr:transglycosylase SLT domain-containing protein [Thermoanaerobaculia bacterium]